MANYFKNAAQEFTRKWRLFGIDAKGALKSLASGLPAFAPVLRDSGKVDNSKDGARELTGSRDIEGSERLFAKFAESEVLIAQANALVSSAKTTFERAVGYSGLNGSDVSWFESPLDPGVHIFQTVQWGRSTFCCGIDVSHRFSSSEVWCHTDTPLYAIVCDQQVAQHASQLLGVMRGHCAQLAHAMAVVLASGKASDHKDNKGVVIDKDIVDFDIKNPGAHPHNSTQLLRLSAMYSQYMSMLVEKIDELNDFSVPSFHPYRPTRQMPAFGSNDAVVPALASATLNGYDNVSPPNEDDNYYSAKAFKARNKRGSYGPASPYNALPFKQSGAYAVVGVPGAGKSLFCQGLARAIADQGISSRMISVGEPESPNSLTGAELSHIFAVISRCPEPVIFIDSLAMLSIVSPFGAAAGEGGVMRDIFACMAFIQVWARLAQKAVLCVVNPHASITAEFAATTVSRITGCFVLWGSKAESSYQPRSGAVLASQAIGAEHSFTPGGPAKAAPPESYSRIMYEDDGSLSLLITASPTVRPDRAKNKIHYLLPLYDATDDRAKEFVNTFRK